MLKMPFRGAVLHLMLLATCPVLTACVEGASGASSASADAVVAGGTESVGSDTRVTIQMTGILLIVPPDRPGDSVHVLLPNARGEDHVALFGFGVAGIPWPASCVSVTTPFGKRAHDAGICYVDLDVWTLQPLGAGGQPATPTLASIPPGEKSGLLNVTALSGGKHTVHFPLDTTRFRTEVVLLAGEVERTCKLAHWAYHYWRWPGYRGPRHTDSLANVVYWQMQTSAPLEFRNHSSGEIVTIPLQPGEMNMVLAHVPREEMYHLPPGKANGVTVANTAHFQPYYSLLSEDPREDYIPSGSRRRRVPRSLGGKSIPCTVTINVGARVEGGRSIGTYACVVSTGERGS
jgi:hypothetical protein